MEGFLVKDSTNRSGGQNPPILFQATENQGEYIGASTSTSVRNSGSSKDKDYDWGFISKGHTTEILVFHHLTFQYEVANFTFASNSDMPTITEGYINFSMIKSWMCNVPTNYHTIKTTSGATQSGQFTFMATEGGLPELMTYSQQSNAGIHVDANYCWSTSVKLTILDISISRYILDFDT